MCSTKADVDNLALRDGATSDGIGDMEINEWSGLLTNEQEIAVTQHIPVTLTMITDDNIKRANAKFHRNDSITSSWQNRKSTNIMDANSSSQQRGNNEYLSNNLNTRYGNKALDGAVFDASSPPQLPPKSSNITNNAQLNGHANILNAMTGKRSSSNNVTCPNTADWIELKSTNRNNGRSPTPKVNSSSHGAVKRNGINSSSTAGINGNTTMRAAPPPPLTAPSQQCTNDSSASLLANGVRKMSSTSSSSLSSSSVASSMTLAVSSSPSSREKYISVRSQQQDFPNIHIPIPSNSHRAISSSSTGVSPTSSSSSSSATVGSSPSGVLQPSPHCLNSTTYIQSRDCNGIVSLESADGKIVNPSNNFTSSNVAIHNENFDVSGAVSTTTTLSQLVSSSSSSQKIMVHQQEHPSITTTVLSAFAGGNSGHAPNNGSTMQFVLSQNSSSSSSSSPCCNDTATTINSNCSKEKIIKGKNNFVRPNHSHHPLKTSLKNGGGSSCGVSENVKGPAPQPPILQQPRPKMILIHQRSLDYNGAEIKTDNSFELSSSAIVSQPTRSTSVSRGLQVEEQDLIQFSSQQPRTVNENPSGSPSSNSTAKLIPSNNNNNNTINNNGKSPLDKRTEDKPDERLNGNGDKSDKMGSGDRCDDIKGDDNEGLDNNANDCGEEDDEEDDSSARTADEQMDYLESLEPCPCYAKCCLDSIITLFCVTLLG